MTAQPVDPPEYDREADLEEQERFALPPDVRPKRHKFVEQPGTYECGDCSMPFDFGALHFAETTEPLDAVTEPGEYQHDDLLLAASGVYRVRRSAYDGLRFVPLEAIADGQGRPPHGAKLIVRGGEIVR